MSESHDLTQQRLSVVDGEKVETGYCSQSDDSPNNSSCSSPEPPLQQNSDSKADIDTLGKNSKRLNELIGNNSSFALSFKGRGYISNNNWNNINPIPGNSINVYPNNFQNNNKPLTPGFGRGFLPPNFAVKSAVDDVNSAAFNYSPSILSAGEKDVNFFASTPSYQSNNGWGNEFISGNSKQISTRSHVGCVPMKYNDDYDNDEDYLIKNIFPPCSAFLDSSFGVVHCRPKNVNFNGKYANNKNKKNNRQVFQTPSVANSQMQNNCCSDNDSCSSSSSTTAPSVTNESVKIHQQFHENMMKPSDVKYIDTHCHVDLVFQKSGFGSGTFSEFKAQYKDTWSPRYGGCIADFCFPKTYMFNDVYNQSFMKKLSENDDVWLALGCHPHQADSYDDVVSEFITKQVAENNKIVAIGEMGLDYSSNNGVDKEIQKSTLEKQLRLAVELKKPILLHCRDAADDCLEIFTSVVPPDHPIHWHCFSESFGVASRWYAKFSNLYFGVTTGVYAPRQSFLTEFYCGVSLDRLLIETDAPYFVPSFYRKNFGNLDFNHPGIGALVGLKLAELRKVDVDDLMKQIYENTKKIYNISL